MVFLKNYILTKEAVCRTARFVNNPENKEDYDSLTHLQLGNSNLICICIAGKIFFAAPLFIQNCSISYDLLIFLNEILIREYDGVTTN